MVPQEEKFADKRLSEQATKKLKDLAAAAIARRERALHSSREAVVRHGRKVTAVLIGCTTVNSAALFCSI